VRRARRRVSTSAARCRLSVSPDRPARPLRHDLEPEVSYEASRIDVTASACTTGANSSQTEPGGIANCPQAGRWAISVWSGEDGTDTGQALGACGEGAVAAAYFIDPDTQVWRRWFVGRPDISNLSTLDRGQGIVRLGTGMSASSAAHGELKEAAAEGMLGCPQPGKWAISVWPGATGTPTGEAVAGVRMFLLPPQELERLGPPFPSVNPIERFLEAAGAPTAWPATRELPTREATEHEETATSSATESSATFICRAPASGHVSFERLFPSGGFGGSPFPPRFHPGFTPIFESEGLAISPSLCGELVPSKQVTRVRFPSPAPAPTRCNSART